MSEEFPIYLQYQNSPKLINLSEKISNSLLFKNWNFPDDYLNIKTANTAGLDNWGKILNQPRTVNSGLAYPKVFGFDDGIKPQNTDDYPQNFYDSNFYNPNFPQTQELNDTQYRALLLLLYRKYTTNNSIYELNGIIREYAVFNESPGIPVVFSGYDMSITYKFDYVLQPYEYNLFKRTDCLSVPVGVKLKLIFTY